MMRMDAVNENTWIVYLGDEISDDVAQRVSRLVQRIRSSLGPILIDIIPSYTSVLVSFDLYQADRFVIAGLLRTALTEIEDGADPVDDANEIILPVYYGSETALDMEVIMQECQLDRDEVIHLHVAQVYRVYAIGFSPGFAYLGNTPSALRVARKATPRLKVPAGSLGIADNQTAIYPAPTPGGWQIIGRTPLDMVDWGSETLTRVKVGDRVRFEAIDRDTFIELGGCLDGL